MSLEQKMENNTEDLVMDDCAAAMVLMSLSCSPKSPLNVLNRLHTAFAAAKYSSSTDSGVLLESPQDPTRVKQQSPDMLVGEMELDPMEVGTLKRKRIIFMCTWPGCDVKYRSNSAIERHVRAVHLGPSAPENEEEFYYTEIEVFEEVQSKRFNSPSVTESEGSEHSSGGLSPVPSPGPYILSPSAPTWSHLDMARPPHEDPEYQERLRRQQMFSSPINIPGVSFAHFDVSPSTSYSSSSRHSAYSTSHKSKVMRIEGKSLLASPKGRTGRTRGETRKCRKVYGMEARDSWCTQCKWKKACTRFTD